MRSFRRRNFRWDYTSKYSRANRQLSIAADNLAEETIDVPGRVFRSLCASSMLLMALFNSARAFALTLRGERSVCVANGLLMSYSVLFSLSSQQHLSPM